MFQQIIDDVIGHPDGPEEREAAASNLIETCGYASAAVTLLPLPGSEILAVMPIHVGMVVGLGQLYGVDISQESASEMVMRIGATVGASLVTTRVATTLAKIVMPGLGGLVGAPLIFATTLAIGAVARTWMAREGDMSSQEMKSVYKEAVKDAKNRFDPSRMRSEKMKDMARKAATQTDAPPKDAPPPPPKPKAQEEKKAAAADARQSILTRLKELKALHDAGLIEDDEFERTKKRILAEI